LYVHTVKLFFLMYYHYTVIVLFVLLAGVVVECKNDNVGQQALVLGQEGQGGGAFNTVLATRQLMLSYAAYCGPSAVQAWNCHWCSNTNTTTGFTPTSLVVNDTTAIFAFVGEINNTVNVVFRGTVPESLEDWIEDLQYSELIPYPKNPTVLVHSGFWDAFLSVRDALRAGFTNLMKTTTPTNVYFTGHSLGAALATICALDFVEDGLLPAGIPATIYNFGSPRVGNKGFAEYFEKEFGTFGGATWRVVNKADVVPHMPFQYMNFYHVNTEVWYTSSTSYKVCTTPEDPSCSDSVIFGNVFDHATYLGYDIIPYCWITEQLFKPEDF